MRILFVTWDGPGLAYLESLFLPIFAGLKEHGFHFDVLQFRWGDPASAGDVGRRCEALGIGYRSVPVWRRGGSLGPFASALAGGARVRRAVRAFGSDAVMPRSVLPSLAVLAGRVAARCPVILDADGLELDERVEFAGLSSKSLTYRFLRDVEAQMARLATAVVTRTPDSREILLARAGPALDPEDVHLVTNGRDEQVFHAGDNATRAAVRREIGVAADAPLIVYAGSVGYRYNTPRIGAFVEAVRQHRSDAKLLLLSGSPEAAVNELGSGGARDATVLRVAPFDVPRYLSAADVGTAFVRPTFSTRGVAPIKIGEYLLCGVPVVGAAQVGNNAPLVAANVFRDDHGDLDGAARWFVEEVLHNRDSYRVRARAAGLEHLSLRRSVADYVKALTTLSAAGASV
jgi:glycosyltransferase involved in cell wall biosynthesis